MFDPLFTAAEVLLPALVAWLYLRRCRTLQSVGRAPSAARQLTFAAGILVWAAVTLTPLARLAEELVSAHMVQHLLLTDLAAVLMVLGLTGPVLAPVLRRMKRLRWLLLPIPALALWIVGFYGWHLPPLYEGALDSAAIHGAEHGTFLVTGIGKWMLLVGPAVVAAGFAIRLGVAVVGHLSVAALGNVFMWSGTAFYPAYAQSAQDLGVSPLTDQSVAGAIMTVEGMVLTLGLGAWLLLRWASEETERQELLELAERRGRPLAEERARRAVAGGYADRLRSELTEEGKGATAR